MKLYVINPSNQRIYLNLTASSRSELASLTGGSQFYVSNNLYNVKQVFAERDSNNTATGSVVGGAVGALGGPIGIVIGGVLGGLIGNNSDKAEDARVDQFNKS